MSIEGPMNEMEMEDDNPVTSESESESEEEDGYVKLTEPSKTAIYNKTGLLDKLGDIIWPENVDWIHKLTVDIHQEQEIDVNDDLTRELAFYTQALESTRQAFLKFQSMGKPFLRPSDYLADMAKSDSRMEKVKVQLVTEKRKTEEANERRKAGENKKLAKEIQAGKQKEKSEQKKEEIESVKKWRKQRQQSGFPSGDKDGDLSFASEDGKAFERPSKKRAGVKPGDRSGGKGKRGFDKKRKDREYKDSKFGFGGSKKRKDREYKDSKFGFGGRKGLKKQNTVETTSDFRGSSQGRKKQKK